jgi:iron complex transport system ATP-binding protein
MTLLLARDIEIPGRLSRTSLEFSAGGLVAIVGPNGGGKTSLLRALAGAEDATGAVVIDGERVSDQGEARRRQSLAFLPASRDLGWPISVRDVIALGLTRRDEARIAELIAQFELGAFADRPVSQTSTGERSRVLLARAIAARPRLLLLDEVFANLEPYWVLRVSQILREIADGGALVIIALHDLAQLAHFDRVLVVANGAVQLDGTPAQITASGRFAETFRIQPVSGGWTIRPADRQSLP